MNGTFKINSLRLQAPDFNHAKKEIAHPSIFKSSTTATGKQATVVGSHTNSSTLKKLDMTGI
ncbi:MAG: hypothetical protein KME59_18750 [Trichormus sp. ATA11-4-KO1]|jgi:hypothetical protein|nr:hypothetical protein [Trichormus sp. ATA11-4-KO1]